MGHLRAVPQPIASVEPAEIPKHDRALNAARNILVLGNRTLERLRAVEHDDALVRDLLRSLPQHDLGAARLFSSPKRDGLLAERIAFEDGRRTGIDEALYGLDGGAA